MAVIPHFVAGADPADIAQGLEPGKYMAQPSGPFRRGGRLVCDGCGCAC